MKVRFTPTLRPLGIFICLGMIGSGWCVPLSEPFKASFSESLRKESKTTTEAFGNGSSSETKTVCFDRWSFSFDAPLSTSSGAKFDATTPYLVRIGSFEHKGTLGDEVGFKPGLAKVIERLTNPSGKSTTILVQGQISWSETKLSLKLDAKGFSVKPVVAGDFVEGLTGPIEGETRFTFQVGSLIYNGSLPIKGKVNRKSGEATGLSTSVSGYAATVNLSGNIKSE